jgi:NitT/TauT family transport system substrate-binding protein
VVAPALRDRLACRHIVTGLALCLTALALLGACHTGNEKTESPLIRLGSYEWPGSFWIDVALAKGWFAEEGLRVERVNTDRKYFASLEAVARGELDGMGFSQFDLVRSVAAGNDLVGVAAIDSSEGAEALVARAGIRNLRELRGKRIALQRGTYLEYLLDIAAERAGLTLDQFVLVDRSQEEAVSDMKAGTVDAAFIWEPYVTQAQRATNGERVFSTADFSGLTYSVFTLRRDFVTARPDDVQKLMRVWQRAVAYVREHPDESCAIVAKSLDEKLEEVREILPTDRVLDAADNMRAFSYAAGFESLHGSWRRMNDFMLERGLVQTRVASPDHLDPRFVHALD